MKESVFSEYPDVVNVDQLRKMSVKCSRVPVNMAAYQLLHEGKIRYFKIGKAFRIPKVSVIRYLGE